MYSSPDKFSGVEVWKACLASAVGLLYHLSRLVNKIPLKYLKIIFKLMSTNNFTKHYKFIKVLNTTSLQITKLLKFPIVNIIKKCIQNLISIWFLKNRFKLSN